MHVQSCCFANLSKPVAFLPFSLPSSSSLLKPPDVTHRDSQRHVSRNTELQCCNYVVAMRNNVAAMLKALGTRLKKNNKNNNCSNSSAVEFQLILWIILNLHFTLATYIIAYKTTLKNDQLFFPYVVTVVCVKVWVFTQVTTIDAFTPHVSSARCQCNSAVFRYRVSSFFHESLVILVLCENLIWVKCLCHDKFFLFSFSLQLL